MFSVVDTQISIARMAILPNMADANPRLLLPVHSKISAAGSRLELLSHIPN